MANWITERIVIAAALLLPSVVGLIYAAMRPGAYGLT